MRPNTACASIAAAAVPRRARPRPASPPARSPAGYCRKLPCAGALVQMGPHKIEPRQMGLGRDRAQSVQLPRQGQGGVLRGLSRRHPQKGIVDRRRHRDRPPRGVPAGIGRADLRQARCGLAAALMSINAVKGVEIGAGFGAAELSGEENADEMRMGNQGVSFLSNHAGGILGASLPGSRWWRGLRSSPRLQFCRRAAPSIAAAPIPTS